ncbi:MAG: hypothetical protein AB7O70_03990 [Hyphomicrobiales bacterium]
MSSQRLVALIKAQIAKLPDRREGERRRLYARLKGSLGKLATNSDGVLDQERHRQMIEQFDTAIAFVEADYAADGPAPGPHPAAGDIPAEAAGTDFAAGAVAPSSRWRFPDIKVLCGCGAAAIVLDLIKPLANLQGAAFVVSLLAAIASTAALRLGLPYRSLLRGTQLASMAMAAVLLGLFGIELILPGEQPNGIIAYTVPGMAGVQKQPPVPGEPAEPIEDTARTTGTRAGQTQPEPKDLRDANDPVREPERVLAARGFSKDADGLVKAIAEQDMTAQDAFEILRILPTADALKAGLLSYPVSSKAFQNIAERIRRDAAKAWGKEIAAELRHFLPTPANNVLPLMPVRKLSCPGDSSFAGRLFSHALGELCGKEAQWIEACLTFLNRLYEIAGLSINANEVSLSYLPSQARVVAVSEMGRIDPGRDGLPDLRQSELLFQWDSEKTYKLFDLERKGSSRWGGTPPVFAACPRDGAVCKGTVTTFITSEGRFRFVAFENVTRVR